MNINLKKALSIALLTATATATMEVSAAEMTGAGSSFIYPVLSKWSEAYKAKTGNNLNYQSIGSGGGIKQINAKTVDFGATDDPVKADDLHAKGQVQFPAIVGGVVAVVNLDGVKPGELKLSPDVLAKIFQGVIISWNDKRILALNPGVNIPANVINVVTRSDGSGTTAIFTNYLSKVSPSWKEEVGFGKTVNWPATSTVSGKGNEGVAANVTRVKNSIGYVEYAFAKKNNMTYASLQNAEGKFVLPDDTTFAAAASGTDWTKFPGMATFITNAPGANAWPITGATFIVMYKNPSDKAKAAEVMKFFDFGLKQGKQLATDLDYVPLPDETINYIEKTVWSQVITK